MSNLHPHRLDAVRRIGRDRRREAGWSGRQVWERLTHGRPPLFQAGLMDGFATYIIAR